ncbi:MAG: hypothetical protein LH474_01670 [Chamaesiphon sp.]|nr:hypothetical protein [Chamaesiphon sp.]
MPERAINTKSATGFLLVLIPAALTMSALFVAWPVILGVTLLIAGGNVWQSYEWSKTAQSIDPVFQQLIVQNRGEISPIDLSLKANISGKISQRYLAIRADEFGTGSRQHPDRGQVYYFVSISTLGSIFDDSEQELELHAIAPATTPVAVFPTVATPLAAIPEELVSTATIPPIAKAIPIVTSIVEPLAPPAIPLPVESGAGLSNLRQLFDEEPAPPTTLASVETAVTEPVVEPVIEPVVEGASRSLPDTPIVTIIQSELAKRLDVHSSTIYKRRSEPDFTDWTRNRDPDGLAWGYAEAAKEYYRLDT